MKPFYEQDGVTIYCGNCLGVLQWMDAVDHVITDPPYSEHVHSKSRAGSRMLKGTTPGTETAPSNYCRTVDFGFESLSETLRHDTAEWITEFCQRWALVFSDVESAHLWSEALTARGFDYCRTGAWVKEGATPQFTGDRPAVGFEAITICHRRGRKRWNGGGSHGVWSVPIVQNRGGMNETRCHPTQKPEALMRQLISLFTDPGETILDPFMGSGTTLVAAKRLGRKAIGIEVSAEYCEVAAKRLRQGALPLGWEAA